jgi:diketogulonate reductase-like aldo/keto reductase
MNYETVRTVTLPKIGFGAWKIGGEMSARPAHDAASLAALRSALELGYTHFDTAEAYLDLYLIHWPSAGMRLGDTFRALNKLVRDGKVRHLGVSNFDLKLLKQAVSLSETPLLTNQVPYSLSDRSYARNGVLTYCQQNDIVLTAYSPVEVGRLRATPKLQAIAKAHQASVYQIALAWLAAQPRVITIPMSANPRHQAENLAAADIALSPAEMEQLDSPG